MVKKERVDVIASEFVNSILRSQLWEYIDEIERFRKSLLKMTIAEFEKKYGHSEFIELKLKKIHLTFEYRLSGYRVFFIDVKETH